jgi:hypothetical protein
LKYSKQELEYLNSDVRELLALSRIETPLSILGWRGFWRRFGRAWKGWCCAEDDAYVEDLDSQQGRKG